MTATDPRSEFDVVADPERALAMLQPQRLELLEQLDEPSSAAALGRRLGLPRQRLNYHLHELERHGFVEVAETRRRGSAVERIYRRTGRSYAISAAALGRLGEPAAEVQDRFSSSWQIALASRTLRELGALRDAAALAAQPLPTLALDVEVRFATPAARQEFAEALAGALANLVERYHDAGSDDGRTYRVYAGAYPRPRIARDATHEPPSRS